MPQTFADYQEGDIAYKDLNGDKIIDGRDVKELGNSFPRTTLGIDFNVSYKGWGLYLQDIPNWVFTPGQQMLITGIMEKVNTPNWH